MRRIPCFALATVLLCAVGCGGGGGDSGGGTGGQQAAPRVPVAWPERSRAVSAPSSALSATFSFAQIDGQASTSFTADRPSGTAAQTSTYTASQQLPVGGYHFSANFYANAAEGGALVGTANADVRLQPDGSLTQLDGQPLGTIGFDTKIQSVRMYDQGIAVGSTVQLSPSVQGPGPLVVTPGSFSFSIVSGGSFIDLTSDGKVTGLAAGDAVVRATVDGVASNNTTIHVYAVPPNIITVPLPANDLVCDETRGVIWVSVRASSSTSANMVVPVSVSDGSLGTGIPVANLGRIAISDDGQFLFAASGNTVKRIQVSSGTSADYFTAVTGSEIIDLEAKPGSNDVVAVATVDATNHQTDTGTFIVDAGGARAKHPKVGQSIAFDATGAFVYGIQRFITTNVSVTSAAVTSQGLSVSASAQFAWSGQSGRRLAYGGGRLYLARGEVVEAATLTSLGKLNVDTVETGDWRMAVNAGENRVYALHAEDDSPKTMMLFDATTMAQVGGTLAFTGAPGKPDDIVACGSHTIAFRTVSQQTDRVLIIKGMP